MKTPLLQRTASSLVAAIAVVAFTACGGGGDIGADNVAAISPGPAPGVVPTPAAASKAWGTPRLIDADNTQNESSPKITMDASGNALASWGKYEGQDNRFSMWTSLGTPTVGWSKPTQFQSNTAGDIGVSDIKFDANGNALAVGIQRDGMQQNIWAYRYTPGSGWGTAVPIKTNGNAVVEGVKIAFDASGNAMVVWSQSDNANPSNIWANRYTPGSGWGTAELIESDNAGNATQPQIAMDASGNAVAVWHQQIGNWLSIYATRYTPGSGWGMAALIETNEGDASGPKIALDAIGNALVVWTQSEGSRFSRTGRSNIWTNRYTPGNGWGTAKLIDANNARLAVGAEIAMNASGNAMAVWFQTDSPHLNIGANRYTPGSGWGTPELIEADNAGDASHPVIAMDADGNALAVWRRSVDSRFSIRTNRYISGIGWSKAAAIDAGNAGFADLPQIAMNASGNAVAVWAQTDGTKQKVWVASYR